MRNQFKTFGRLIWRSYIFFIILGLVVGLSLAPLAWSMAADEADGTIAVIPVEGTITGQSEAAYAAAMQQARENPDIKAVVIVSNSGGGGAASSEGMNMETKRTAEQMPVVASIDAAAASGAYHTIVPSDYIYTKPGSIVGSIGVLATIPPDLEPNDIIATTGPNKLTGANEREFFYLLESVQEAFIGSVIEHRGTSLHLSNREISQARIYSGVQAVDNGLADEVGNTQEAIRRAARMAGLDDYRVKIIRPDSTTQFISRNNYRASDSPDKEMISASQLVGTDTAPVVLMVPRSYVAGALSNQSVIEAAKIENTVTQNSNQTTDTAQEEAKNASN